MLASMIRMSDAGVIALFAFAYGLLVLVMHIIMAIAVARDASRLVSDRVMSLPARGHAKRLVSDRNGLFFFGPALWGWIVLVFGLAGLGVYWAFHHSSLRADSFPKSN